MRAFVVVALLISSPLWASSTGGSGTSSTSGPSKSKSITQIYPWAVPYPPGTTTLYVAPNGVGTSGCTITAPCSINLISSNTISAAGAVVYLRGGFYYLSSTIAPVNTSGGTIIYAAYPGETPIITGAQPLSGWADASASGRCGAPGVSIPGCWSTTVPTGLLNFDYLIYIPAGWPPSYTPYVMSRRTQSVNTPTGYNLNAG